MAATIYTFRAALYQIELRSYGLEDCTYVRMRILIGNHILDGIDGVLLEGRILSLRPPVGNEGESGIAEVLVDVLVGPFVGREEREEILHTALTQERCEVVDRLLGEVGTEDYREDVDRHVCSVMRAQPEQWKAFSE